jgi:hypothetical protein
MNSGDESIAAPIANFIRPTNRTSMESVALKNCRTELAEGYRGSCGTGQSSGCRVCHK